MKSIRNIYVVGPCLRNELNGHHGYPVELGQRFLIGRSVHHIGDVLDLHGHSILFLDDQFLELVHIGQFAQCPDAELNIAPFNTPRWQLHILAAYGVAHIQRSKVVGGEFHRIEKNPDGIAFFAKDSHLTDSGNGLQPLLEDPVRNIRKFQQGAFLAAHTQKYNGAGIGVLFAHCRRIAVGRKLSLYPRHPVAYIVCGCFQVCAQHKLHGEAATSVATA